MSQPKPDDLLCETPAIRRWLSRLGVPESDLDDVVAEVVASAWASIVRGSFKPDPELAPKAAFQKWIWGVTWRQGSTALNRAYRRRELVFAEVPDSRTTTEEPAILARDELTLLCGIPLRRRAVLLAHAAGCSMPEIAKALGIPVSTGWTHLRLARVDLLAILRRRAARDRR